MQTQMVPGIIRSPERTTRSERGLAWLWLTALVVVGVAILSAIGMFVPGVYRDPLAWAVQGKAQDFTDLVLVVPVLAVSGLFTARGSVRGRLVWLGTLSYLVYALVIYAFSVQHNPLFLGYVSMLSCSLWALIGGMATTDWGAIKAQFPADPPLKVVSLFLLVVTGLFYLLWLSDEVPALVAGAMPASIKGMGVPTNPVHVLDLAMLLPAMALSGLWLWQKRAMGYGLAAMMLVHTFFQALGIGAVMIFSLYAGLDGAVAVVAVFMVLAVVILVLMGWYVRGMRTADAERIG